MKYECGLGVWEWENGQVKYHEIVVWVYGNGGNAQVKLYESVVWVYMGMGEWRSEI